MTVYTITKSMLPLARKIILRLVKEPVLNEDRVQKIRNELTKTGGGILPKNLELIQAYHDLIEEGVISPSSRVLKIIQKRKVRTLSGIANITVLTKDLGCPGQCIYCPAEKGMPKSYLSNEPAMMRAVRNDFDSYKQVKTRLNGLVAQGHDVSKIDMRTAGGTWGAIPVWYQEEFLKGIYLALNEGPGEFLKDDEIKKRVKKATLDGLIKQNETADCRCVGLWVETRPDWVTKEEIARLRGYGVTGIELGVQTTDDLVNKFCRRGHGVAEAIKATKLCRRAGLKICHHLMPNLPAATPAGDVKSGKELFKNPGLRPDYLKIYPCIVTPCSPLAEMVKTDPKVHTPYTDAGLAEVLVKIKRVVPEYCRIIRIVRDIPAESIVYGSKKSNLRQIIQRAGARCRCIRCREIKDAPFDISKAELREMRYEANGMTEVFLTFDEPEKDLLIALCRLTLPDPKEAPFFNELTGAALVRELHVYGREQNLPSHTTAPCHSRPPCHTRPPCHSRAGGNLSSSRPNSTDPCLRRDDIITSNTQHLGLGKRLMARAEEIARSHGYARLAVIAAIGTREYYKKLGYRLAGTYMVKDF